MIFQSTQSTIGGGYAKTKNYDKVPFITTYLLNNAERQAMVEQPKESRMIYLMNSAVMPAGNYGNYNYVPSSVKMLEHILTVHPDKWKSYIGYPQNAALIKKWTGVEVPINRETVAFKDGDRAFVMRLKSRMINPTTKGEPVSEDPNDWEFALVSYRTEKD